MNTIKPYEERVKEEKERAKDEIRIRYYFWDWCMPYGWRQMGNGQGYVTLGELKKDNQWGFKNANNWKILKAQEIERKIK